MRRRLLLTLAFPPQRGGMQRHLAQWVALAADRYVVSAPAWPEARRWDAAYPAPVIRWQRGPRGRWGWRRVQQVAEARRTLLAARQTFPIGALELGQAWPFGWVALWAHRRWGLPYDVWTFGDEILKPVRFPGLRGLTRHLLRQARRVYAISRFTARVVGRVGVPEERVHVVHPWPAALFRPGDRRAARRALGLEEDSLLLLTVARLEPRKGVDRVLQVLPELLRAFPRLRYAVVGEGRARSRWRALSARLGVDSHVLWPGAQSDEELLLWYQAADVFVLIPTPGPHEVEGFGLVFAEAAACALPAVAGDNGGVSDAVLHGKSGLIVPPEDPAALKEALSALLADRDLRREMGRNALEHATRLRRAAHRWVQEVVHA